MKKNRPAHLGETTIKSDEGARRSVLSSATPTFMSPTLVHILFPLYRPLPLAFDISSLCLQHVTAKNNLCGWKFWGERISTLPTPDTWQARAESGG